MSSTRPGARRRTDLADFVSTVDAISDDEHVSDDEAPGRRRGRQLRKQELTQYDGEDEDDSEGSAEDSIDTTPRRTTSSGRALRSANRPARLETSDDEVVAGNISGDDAYFLQSDLPGSKKRPRTLRLRGPRPPDFVEDDIGYERNKRQRTAMRHSERTTRHQGGMKEVDVDNIYRSDSDQGVRAPMKPKTVGTKEIFKPLPPNNEFRLRHTLGCETCGNGSNFAPLIHCQGCTLAYHKGCLGHRTGCEHLVTKVGEDDFVLQCRRCLAFSRKKDGTAPDQGKCQECHEHGVSCRPFRHRKTPLQEQREREENDGVDPITPVDPVRINVANNVMFRCVNCMRAWHFEHLPSRSDIMDLDTEVDVDQRFREYSRDWNCRECADMPAKVSALIAWKPIDEDSYDDAMAYELIDENEKAYLVKWADMSYFRACWMPGAWVWGVTNSSMRKAFAKREDAQHPKMRTKDAIPEDYFRADIVLHIKYTSIVDIRTQEIDKARILEVDKALIKYKGLSYEDAVWEKPPRREDGERWTDFVRAYNDWVFGRYVRPPKPSAIKSRLEKARVQSFEKFEKQAQPDVIEGGELMQYQIEGLNWLYYKWYTQKNAILADEMGLGKTIQMIGFLATLVQDWNCFPFLIVVPNSTCPNWRREVKRWAPSLRVVAFYGSKESRDLAYRYELFPEGSKELRCHIVIISYETAGDEHCRKFLRSVPWQGLILDEGQRLKSGKTQLYAALGALKAPFKILMTGTPLQNNQRELFNLLQFLDDGYDAEQLEQRFRDLDQSKINELHDMIRPFFLRRTKAQVLTFLPPMAQIILPVSMSVVQKKVYRTILAKNPDLMKAIFSPGVTLKGPEKASLSNILMQLRKCLCHPFVYNKGIEERSVSHTVSHRNLVDASSKLKLLELLLPKLQERGHRVLIFSQFLDMLDMVEDFLDGMGLLYQRLDGTVSSLQKQKRIDEFNAPGSAQFAFLLSTRAGGVGINLATADTVIILDPDFNPHQDIQALSRAHRIGQTKKVLCFQLVTRSSAEEKIMQIGRKKLALDHVLIQEMDAEDASQTDLVSVLRYGANELFNDDGEQDIVYDNLGVEKLLDRSQIEDTAAGRDQSAETQWSFARVWANNQATLQDAVVVAEEQAPDPGVWDNILKERERIAAEEAVQKAKALGRGRRARGHIDYAGDKVAEGVEGLELPPQAKRRKVNSGGESDTDFQDEGSGAESGDEQGEMAVADSLDLDDAKETKRDPGGKKTGKKPRTQQTALPTPITTPQGKLGAATAQAKAAATPIKSAKKPAKVKSQPRARGSAPTAKKPRGGATHTISFPGKGLLMAPKPRRPRSKITTKSAEAGAQPPKHVGKKQARAKASAGGGQTPAAPMKESASQPSHTASVLTDTNVNVNVSNPANAGNVAVAGEESDDKVSENNITFVHDHADCRQRLTVEQNGRHSTEQ